MLIYLNTHFYTPIHYSLNLPNPISVTELKNIYNLLVTDTYSIYKTIEFLNEREIYHNDIKPNNTVYNKDLNKIYLIDFGESVNKAYKQKYVHYHSIVNFKHTDKFNFCSNTILFLLYVSIGNKYIYDNDNIKKTITEKHT